jgi:hypothetical protein
VTTPTYFTVVADFKSVVGDLASDADYDPQLGSVTADVTFLPVLDQGDVILATSATPRPTGFLAAPIVGFIDTDGRLKMRTATDVGGSTDLGYAPVRLLADTDLLELETPLFYQVSFSNVQYNGARGTINPFTFQAPTSDTTLNLITVARAPGQPPTSITRLAPGGVRLEDGDLIFSFAGEDIPNPVPLEVSFTSSEVTDSTSVGRAVLTAVDAAAARTAIGAGTSSLVLGTTDSTAKAGDYQPAAEDISDASVVGVDVLTAVDEEAAIAALGISLVDNGDGTWTLNFPGGS